MKDKVYLQLFLRKSQDKVSLKKDKHGNTILYAEASNENLDFDNEKVLQNALIESKDYFLKNGVVSYDHKHFQDIDNLIGQPIDVSFDTNNKKTYVKFKLYKDNSIANKIIKKLKNGASIIKVSIGGQMAKLKENLDGKKEIAKVLWNEIALTYKPVNQTLDGISLTPISSVQFVKSIQSVKKSVKSKGLQISKSIKDRIIKSTENKNKVAQEALILEIKSTMDRILKENIKKIVGTKEIITKSNSGEWCYDTASGGFVQKAFSVGTIRTWKDKKYIKIAQQPSKWRRHYSVQEKASVNTFNSLRKKLSGLKTADEVLEFYEKYRKQFESSKDRDHLKNLIRELSKTDNKGKELTTPPSKENKESNKNKVNENKKENELSKLSNQKNKPKEKDNSTKDSEPKSLKENEKAAKKDNNNPFEVIKDKYQNSKSIVGDDDFIQIGKEKIKGKWKLIEADSVTASHNEKTFKKTDGFPTTAEGSTINDRDYETDRDAGEIVMSVAADYDGRALSMDSPVVVTNDGIVVSGNNRTMSSKLAAEKGTDKEYIETLESRAKKFGFTKKDVEQFKHPRVIFEMDDKVDNYTTELFSKFNQNTTKTVNPVERAVKTSKLIKDETISSIASIISSFDTMGELYENKKACMEIFNSLQQQNLITEFDRPQHITENGITTAGKEFLETTLIGSCMSENNIRSLSTDGNKHIRRKLVRAITPLINNKKLGTYSVNNEINDAVDMMVELSQNKKAYGSIDELVSQKDFTKEYGKEATAIAKKMELKEKDFADFLQSLNANLSVGANGQADIFLGGVESKEDILKRVLEFKKSQLAAFENKIKKIIDIKIKGAKNGKKEKLCVK